MMQAHHFFALFFTLLGFGSGAFAHSQAVLVERTPSFNAAHEAAVAAPEQWTSLNAGVLHADKIITLEGALPIMASAEIVGSIGVSPLRAATGTPSAQKPESTALQKAYRDKHRTVTGIPIGWLDGCWVR